jgi:cbb3-type cytochrome oxidase maturation protein
MEVLMLLVPLAVLLVGLALWMFVWAVDKDQFEDLDAHGMDLFEDPFDHTIDRSIDDSIDDLAEKT